MVIARVRRAIFAHHAHPLSAWSRWATTPLVLLPVWTRRRSHALIVATWFALNPVIFPTVSNERPWATRAMLGEELWISRRPRDSATALSVVTSLVAVVALVAAHRHRVIPAAAAVAIQMALTLLYWRQMVRYLENHR
jgi:hypothetical protein